MYSKLLCIFLLMSQVILNESAVDDEEDEDLKRRMRVRPISFRRDDRYAVFANSQVVYKVYETGSFSWFAARDRCSAEGAMLAIPNSMDAIWRIHNLRIKKNVAKWVHTGIWKPNVTNEWVRIDNDLHPSSIPWRASYPVSNGNCTGVAIYGDGLVNYPCDWNSEYYACEKPLNES